MERLPSIGAYASWSRPAREFLKRAAQVVPRQSLPYTAYDALQARSELAQTTRTTAVRMPKTWTPRPNANSFLAFERSIFPRIEASSIAPELAANMRQHMHIDWLLANVYMPSAVCDEAWFAATGLWQSVWVLVDDDFEVTGADLRTKLRDALLRGIETDDGCCNLMAEGIRGLSSIMSPTLMNRLGEEMLLWFEHANIERRLTLHYRETGRLPSFATYGALRAATIATPGCLYVQFPTHHRMLLDADFEALCRHALMIFGLTNDLVSHHKNKPARLVDALIVLARGPTIRETHVRRLVDIINCHIARFEALAQRSALDQRWIQALRNWTGGCVRWGLSFDRYSRFVPIDGGLVEVRLSRSA